MPVRVQKIRSKALIALPLLGVWAGLASGSLGAPGQRSQAPSADSVAAPALASASAPAAAAVPVPPAADVLAVDNTAPGATAAAGLPPDTSSMPSASGPTPASPPVEAPAPPPPASPAATLVPTDRLYLEPILAQAAQEHGLPVDLILAQAWAESGWRIDAVSHKGAVGVLQIMPSAVDFISSRLLKLNQHLDPRDPAANARMGARFMRHLIDRLDGDLRRALIAYNQGLTGLFRKGPVPAAESYADKVLALRPVFAG